ncbi:MAG TPA: response regulator, partial [bacterium]
MEKRERILLVDDDRTFRTVTSSFLTDADYAVDCADSEEKAEEMLKSRRYDMVLTDLKMAGRDGLDLLEFVR